MALFRLFCFRVVEVDCMLTGADFGAVAACFSRFSIRASSSLTREG